MDFFHPFKMQEYFLDFLPSKNNRKHVYNLLFNCAGNTLKELAKDKRHLGAEIGFIAILHTWSQTLMYHLHVHCIVTGGGLALNGIKWVACKGDFFLPVKVLSRMFKGKFLAHLNESHKRNRLRFPGRVEHLAEDKAFKTMLNELYGREWVVYCKPPIENAEQVIEYLGRYTHRVAISNDRIVKLEGGAVTFSYRDSNDGNKIKLMTLKADEFIRRFLLHILPNSFKKIRHYGLLSNRSKESKLSLCRELFGERVEPEPENAPKETWEELLERLTGIDPRVCPVCGKGRMQVKETLPKKCLGMPQ